MVYLSIIRFCKSTSRVILPDGRVYIPKEQQTFFDSIKIAVQAGSGGSGLPKYAGIGGKGGDVYVEGSRRLQTLKPLKALPHVTSGNGGDSLKSCLLGTPGRDFTVYVPRGVDIRTPEGSLLGTTDKANSKILVARGGQGGCKENNWIGQRGERKVVILDYKLLADVGLVGYPNAGKSTLLTSISRASPKIANYPFTTLSPNLGVLNYPDHRQILMADLPGLIEDSHKNKGLGIRFLRHIERTRLLLFVLDVNGIQLSPESPIRSPFDQLMLLQKEIYLYNPHLMDKPSILVLTKMDVPHSDKKYKVFLQNVDRVTNGDTSHVSSDLLPEKVKNFNDFISISAVKGTNLNILREKIRQTIDSHELNLQEKQTFSELMKKENK